MAERQEFIDIHCHFVPPEFVDALDREGAEIGVSLVPDADGSRRAVFSDGFATTLPFFPGLTDLERRFSQQSTLGIRRQVLSGWNDLFGYQLEPQQGQRLSQLSNDTLAATAARFPDRLTAMATVPLQDGRLAADEVRRVVREYGVRSVQIGTHVNNVNLGESDLDPFWQACQDEGVLVMIHPSRVATAGRFAKFFTSNLVGNPIETTIAAASLLFDQVMARFDGLNVLLVHAGGFLPYQIGRLDQGYRTNGPAGASGPHPPGRYFDRFYFDTLTYFGPALRYLVDLAGPDHVLFGTDIPFPINDLTMSEQLDNELPSLSTGDRELIAGGNAKRLLGL